MRTNARTDRVFRGCFASDQLPPPSLINYPAALIVNRDPHHKKGSHWMAIYANSLAEPVMYFDSLAMSIPSAINYSFLNKFTAGVQKNKNPYQSPFASTCAPLCISFIYYMSLGYTFENFLRILDLSSSPDLFSLEILNKLIKNYFCIYLYETLPHLIFLRDGPSFAYF